MSNDHNISYLFDRFGNLTPETLERFIASKLSADELSAVELHLEASPFDREALEGLIKGHRGILRDDLKELDARVLAKARQQALSPQPRSIRPYIWAAAAGSVMLIGVAVALVFMFRSPAAQELTVDNRQLTVVSETGAEKPGSLNSASPEIPEATKAPGASGTDNPETELPLNRENAPAEMPEESDNEAIMVTDQLVVEQEAVTGHVPVTRKPDEQIVGGVSVSGQKRTGASKKAMEMQYQAEADAAGLQQEDTASSVSQIFVVVETMPEFPGGEDAFNQYLADSIRYPAAAVENSIQGRVFVTFVVEKDGSVSDARILRGIGGGCDEEALRVIRNMPKWIPGKQRGKPVRVQYNLPIMFTPD
jgi:TonB family protein